jgi:mRNA-degrading endonuclease RelE of RelBE toxin-antitoxin system
MKIVQTRSFSKTVRKLHPNQKKELDKAVKKIIQNPEIGELKVGDLAGYRVYKFKNNVEMYLIGYGVDDEHTLLSLIALGTHENFYREMKKII